MSEDDLYFTHAIVGAPQTMFLGERVTLPSVTIAGMQVNLLTGQSRASQAWQDWMTLHRQDPANGLPLCRPGGFMRWLVRHTVLVSIFILVTGLLALIAAVALQFS